MRLKSMKKQIKQQGFEQQPYLLCVVVLLSAFSAVFAISVSPSEITFDCDAAQNINLEVQTADIRAYEPVFVKPKNKVIKADKITSQIDRLGRAEVMLTLDLDKAASGKTQAGRMDDVQGQMVRKIAALQSDVKYVFENIPVITAKIDSATFEYLKNSDLVSCVEAVIEVQTQTAQGIPLIGGNTYRSIYDGSGTAIAIIDSGVDYTHPALGGGGFPNAKVIGGYDFGNSDADPMPKMIGHGTQCAGVAAGDIVNYADYVGGVAPGSRLYALKVMPDYSGSATSSNIASAVDWCISHQYDDPNNPILVISMSLGDGQEYAGSCDDQSPALTNAVNAAAACGITVLASSGNNGFCDSMNFPACISSVISVGAVFDAELGNVNLGISTQSCLYTESLTYSMAAYADMVAPYSNSSPLVDVLASSNNVYTTDIKGVTGSSVGDYFGLFGGTSAACAYSAGAVASLQSAAIEMIGRFLTPSEVRDVLKNQGEPVEDWKNSIITPRINLAASIENLDIQNGRQITIQNGADPAVISSITAPQWLTVLPQTPIELAGYETASFYAAVDCTNCNYENLTGQIVFSGTDFTAYVDVDMQCPACGLSANLNAGCAVDLADLTILANCWLSTAVDCQNPDINGSGDVSLDDFAVMASQWLEGTTL